MAESSGAVEQSKLLAKNYALSAITLSLPCQLSLPSTELNLSPEERRLFAQVFSAADTEGIGVVTGDVALRFFPEKTKLPSETLGEVSPSCNHSSVAAIG